MFKNKVDTYLRWAGFDAAKNGYVCRKHSG